MFGFLLVLNGCSGYQPPAPVYGHGSATNPYQSTRSEVYEGKRVNQSNQIDNDQQFLVEQKQQIDPAIASKPIVIKKPLSSASIALIAQADQHSKTGDLESAVSTIERALRIDSRNATLTYKLAQLRLKQSKPRLAEDLAKKAALLSASDTALKKQSWLLISEARKQQKNYYGAKEAKLKADQI